jgi:glycosyltransferase involved in cell wall biosynthesis
VELLFEIADPGRDHILVIGEMEFRNSYHQVLMGKANREPWRNKVTVTGFLPPLEVGQLLAASDAVIFPFRAGGGTWNTSVHAAMMQGTFVLITSYQKHGYRVSENVYYARPDDTTDMRQALSTFIGKRNSYTEAGSPISWDEIARSHAAFYRAVVKQG